VWHYLRDHTFSCFDTIMECDRHKRTGTWRRHILQLAQHCAIKKLAVITISEILSLLSENLKTSRDCDHAHSRDSL